jgi:hypothetical protein
MTEPPIDLSPLDPDADSARTDRVIGNVMQHIDGHQSPRPMWGRLAAMLVVGIAVGWFARGLGDPERMSVTLPEEAGGGTVQLAGLFDDLDVSPDQRTRIRTAIESRDPESDELLMAVARELHGLIESRDESIRQVLLPEQRSAYEERVGSGGIVGFRRDYLMERAHVRIEAYLR